MKSNDISSLAFRNNTVSYMGQVYPTGSIFCKVLNIPGDVLSQINAACCQISAVNTMINTMMADQNEMADACASAHELLRLLAAHEPFTFFADERYHVRIDQIFTCDAINGIMAYQTAILTGRYTDAVAEELVDTLELCRLAPVLANIGDALTTIQTHVLPFIEQLDGTESDRTPDGYAAIFAKAFPADFEIGDGTSAWLSLTNVSMQYTAEHDETGAGPFITKVMNFVTMGGLLRADLFEGLAIGHAPKRCPICKRWFLTTDARHTKYCGNVCPGDPHGLTCRQIGNRMGRAQRELSDDHPIKAVYETRMNTIRQSVKRNTLDKDLAARMKKLGRDKLEKALSDVHYAQTAYQAEMEQDALRTEAEGML